MKNSIITLIIALTAIIIIGCGGEEDDNTTTETITTECTQDTVWNGKTPCIDKATNYIWSERSEEITWDAAITYCKNLTEGGYTDWQLPTISELRTLIKECPTTISGGTCAVTDSCLSSTSCHDDDICYGCEYNSSKYSKTGDQGTLWTATSDSDNPSQDIWTVYFYLASVDSYDKTNLFYARAIAP